MKKRIVSIALTVLMLVCALPIMPVAQAAPAQVDPQVDLEGPEYKGNVLVAVNTDYDLEREGAGETFTAPGGAQNSSTSPMSSVVGADGKIDVQLPRIPVSQMRTMLEEQAAVKPASYKVGDTKEIITTDAMNNELSAQLECLFVGERCTIWGQTDCDAKLRISREQAAKIGNEFDGNYDSFVRYFGDAAADVDQDGKVAIFCYDIEEQYESRSEVTAYIAGYFWEQDMVQDHNNVDCIHIDTFPLMGYYGAELSSVEQCYDTLFHEYQHYVNYSTRCEKNSEIDVFTNEAMSMAAEHLVCGYKSVANRVSEFNSNVQAHPGRALMFWATDASGSAVPNYGYAYVWGQYLRTRYAQMTGETGADAGASIYSMIMDRLGTGKDTVQIAADILYANDQNLTTTKARTDALIRDFWIACLVKQNKGYYGFGGETFADAIYVTDAIADHVPAQSGDIFGGGAAYYYIDPHKVEEVTPNGSGLTYAGVRTELDTRDIVLLLDYSGSMEADQIRSLKEASKAFCNQVCDGQQTRVSIVTYNSSNTVRSGLTADKDALISAIDALPNSSGGSTYMAEALDRADTLLQSSDAQKQIIVLMTDGQPNGRSDNTSGRYSSNYASAVYDTANGLLQKYDQNGMDLDIYTLGFYSSDDSDAEQLLADVAMLGENDGSYQKVTQVSDLIFTFAELGSSMNYSGDKVVVTIHCPVEVKVVANPGYIVETDASGIRVYDQSEYMSSSEGILKCTYGEMTVTRRGSGSKVDNDISLYLDQYVKYEIIVDGVGDGTMDLTVVDGKVISSFNDVPINENTEVRSELDYVAEKDLSLRVDNDGDGRVDEVLAPETESRQIYHKITFDPNGGTVDTAQMTTNDEGKLDALPEADREDYKFLGWYTEKDGGEEVTIDTVFVKDTTVYAHWKEKTQHGGGPVVVDPPADTRNPFKDVKKNDWFYDAVMWAVREDVTSGTSYNTFSPGATCTRGQMVTFLWRAAGCPDPASNSNPFKDVDKNSYYGEAVLWAVGEGITQGTSTNTFSPNAQVTRGQMVTFLYRYAGASNTNKTPAFSDVKPNAYYFDAVQWAYAEGVANGMSEDIFAPESACTRGQIVTFLYRYFV